MKTIGIITTILAFWIAIYFAFELKGLYSLLVVIPGGVWLGYLIARAYE